MIAACDFGLWPRGQAPLQVHYIDGAVCTVVLCQVCVEPLQHSEQGDTLVWLSHTEVLNAVGNLTVTRSRDALATTCYIATHLDLTWLSAVLTASLLTDY